MEAAPRVGFLPAPCFSHAAASPGAVMTAVRRAVRIAYHAGLPHSIHLGLAGSTSRRYTG